MHQCLSAVCGVLGYPEGSAAELLDGSLKLRYCTTVLPSSFPLGGVGNRRVVTSGNLLDCGGNSGKRVRLIRKTRPGALSLVSLDPGHSTPRRWKRMRSPSSEGVGSEVGVLDEVCSWRSLEPAFGRNRVGVPAGQSSQRGWCTGTGPF